MVLLHLAIIAFFALVSAVYFWPLPLHFSTHVPGFAGDNFIFLWDQRWVQLALTRLHTSPFQTDWVYYPLGVPLIFHSLIPAHGLLSIPLYALGLGTVPIFNLLFLLSYVLSGYGVWLLVLRLTGSRLAGLVAAISFNFCPYKWAHAQGHLNLISTQWIPLFLLCFHDTLRSRRWHAPLLAGVFLLLQFYSDLQYSIFLLLAAVPVGLDPLLRRELSSRAWARLLVVLGVAFVGALPLLLSARPALAQEGNFFHCRTANPAEFSADLEGYLRPPVDHPVLGGLGAPFTSGGEQTLFLGWTALLLALVGIASARRKAAVWLVTAAGFALLSLGPVIYIHGHALASNPVYSAVKANVPGLESLRTPGRFGVMVMLCVSVLAGFGAAFLAARLRRRASYPLLGAVAGLILFEFAIPSWFADATVPPALYRAREGLPFGTPVFVMPPRIGDGEFFVGGMDFRALYYCLEAGLRCAGSGFASRVPRWRISFFLEPRALRALYRLDKLEKLKPAAFARSVAETRSGLARTLQESLHTDYVLVLPRGGQSARQRETIAAALAEFTPQYEPSAIALYRAPTPCARRLPLPPDAGEMLRRFVAERRAAGKR